MTRTTVLTRSVVKPELSFRKAIGTDASNERSVSSLRVRSRRGNSSVTTLSGAGTGLPAGTRASSKGRTAKPQFPAANSSTLRDTAVRGGAHLLGRARFPQGFSLSAHHWPQLGPPHSGPESPGQACRPFRAGSSRSASTSKSPATESSGPLAASGTFFTRRRSTSYQGNGNTLARPRTHTPPPKLRETSAKRNGKPGG